MSEPRAIKNVVVVGGGTAGWIVAALLGHYAGHVWKVRLVESEEIGTIGVGESTIPPFLQLIARLGISESEFIKHCQASFKLGIEFKDWRRKGESYFHPFGAIGPNSPNVDPYQMWLRAGGHDALPLQSIAAASVMAEEKRFMLPFMAKNSPIDGASYALHVDAKRVASFLRQFAEGKGVTRTEGLIERVEAKGDQVQRLHLKSGETVEGDFFFDCSGFRSLIIGGELGCGLDDWGDMLLCDRAVVVQTENVAPPSPFTLAEAQDAGWRWRIPLQHRTGNGHVFSSRHMSADEAKAILLDKVEGPTLTEPALLKFTTGARREMWKGNAVAMGLSAGFIEPLESTAIHLVYRAVDMLLRYFPTSTDCAALAREFNARMYEDYAEIRDFLIAHYSLTERDDTPFWRDVAAIELPDSLKHRLEVFRDNGAMVETIDGLFSAVSWQSVLDGMGITPRHPHASVMSADPAPLAKDLDRFAKVTREFVKTLPSHADFLAEHVPAPKPETA